MAPRTTALVVFAIAATLLGASAAAWACTQQPTVILSPRAGAPGEVVVGRAKGFSPLPGRPVQIRWNAFDGPILWWGEPGPIDRELDFSFEVPAVEPGTYVVIAVQENLVARAVVEVQRDAPDDVPPAPVRGNAGERAQAEERADRNVPDEESVPPAAPTRAVSGTTGQRVPRGDGSAWLRHGYELGIFRPLLWDLSVRSTRSAVGPLEFPVTLEGPSLLEAPLVEEPVRSHVLAGVVLLSLGLVSLFVGVFAAEVSRPAGHRVSRRQQR